MQFLTDFADQAVMLPLALLVAAALALSGWWRGLAAWLVAVVGVLGTMAVLKYLFFACAGPFDGTGIRSPSGHTAAAAVIGGGLCVLLLRGRLPGWALAAIPPAFAVVFGITRLAVHVHDVPEVLLGAAVGLAGAASLVALAGPQPALRRWPITVGAVLIAILCHGTRLQAEGAVHHFALFTWLPLPTICHA